MSDINNRIAKLPNNKVNNKINTKSNDKGKNANSISKKAQNTIKQINSKKLVNNFVEKYNNTSKPVENNNNGKFLISENMATIVLGIIAFSFIAIGVYLYYKSGDNIKRGKTYLGEDLLSYQPLFKMEVDKIEPCIERCEKDTLCTGISYNKDELQCLGTSKGRLREDEPNQIAWIKDTKKETQLKQLTLVGFTKSSKIIQPKDIPKPKLPHQFIYSFYLYLNDFYENQGVWRHIFHKGNDMVKLNTPNWEDIAKEIPDQSVGVWLAPFHNNIRIALTTLQNLNRDTKVYQHANKQEYLSIDQTQSMPNVFLTDVPSGPKKDTNRASQRTNDARPDYQKNLEYVDITNIPVKKLTHLTISVNETIMEIYLNSKLHKVVELQGYPEFNSGSMSILHPTATNTDILDLKFIPGSLKYPEIKKLYDNKNELTQKYV